MGVVSCLGHDPDEFYNNLLEASLPPTIQSNIWMVIIITQQPGAAISLLTHSVTTGKEWHHTN